MQAYRLGFLFTFTLSSSLPACLLFDPFLRHLRTQKMFFIESLPTDEVNAIEWEKNTRKLN